MKRSDIVIMKQDKGRRVIIMNKIKKIYTERLNFTINETVSETKLGPYIINKEKSSTHSKKN